MGNLHRPDFHLAALTPAELLHRCATVAAAVPVFRLRRPRDMSQLAEAVRRIEGLFD